MLKTTYRTTISRTELHEWLHKKAAQKEGFLIKLSVYRTKKLHEGFRIQKRMTRYSVAHPRVKVLLVSPQTLEIHIRPQRIGYVLLAIIPALAFISAAIFITWKGNWQMFQVLLFIASIVAPISFIMVFWPMFDARKWIERELHLTRQTP